MSHEITASYVLSPDAIAAGLRWSYRRTIWRRLITAAFLAAAVVSLFLFVWKLKAYGIKNAHIELIILCASVGGLIGRRFEVRRSLKSVESSPSCGQTVVYQFDEAGFAISAPGTAGKTGWSNLLDTYATPDGCLLYPQRGIFFWLPTSAFESDSDYGRFLELLAIKTKHSKIG